METGLPKQERVQRLEDALLVPANEGDEDPFRADAGCVSRRESDERPDEGGGRQWPVAPRARMIVASDLGESKARVGEIGRSSKGGRGGGKKLRKYQAL